MIEKLGDNKSRRVTIESSDNDYHWRLQAFAEIIVSVYATKDVSKNDNNNDIKEDYSQS